MSLKDCIGMSAKLKKLLMKNGFQFVRQNGPHIIFERNGRIVSCSRTIKNPDFILKKCLRETDK